MKRFLGVLLLGLLAVAALSMRALANDESCCQGMKMGRHGKKMEAVHEEMAEKIDLYAMLSNKTHLIMENAAELGLSDGQTQKIKTLKMNVEKSKIQSDTELKLLALDIKAGLEKEEIGVNNINALIDKKYRLKSQEAKTLVGAYADLKKVLSKEQMKKLHHLWNREKMEGDKCTMLEGKEECEQHMGMH